MSRFIVLEYAFKKLDLYLSVPSQNKTRRTKTLVIINSHEIRPMQECHCDYFKKNQILAVNFIMETMQNVHQ